MRLILKGLLIGNLIGIGFGFVQDRFNLLGLDPETYYMEYVPIFWNWPIIATLNVLIFLIVGIVLMLPTMIISRISPIKSIRFD
jgi:lipoprotein-releasing system permease protein